MHPSDDDGDPVNAFANRLVARGVPPAEISRGLNALDGANFEKQFLIGLRLSLDWGIIPMADDEQVVFTNWQISEGRPVGDPGLVLFKHLPVGVSDRLVIDSCTIRETQAIEVVHAFVRLALDQVERERIQRRDLGANG